MYTAYMSFPNGASGKEPTCQFRRCKKTWIQSLGRVDPLEEGMATLLVFLPQETHGHRRLADYRPYDYKESNTSEVT